MNFSLNFKDIVSISLVLFSVIDILGSIPVIIDLRKRMGMIEAEKATLSASVIMILFLFVGESILKLFGVDVASFAVAGAIIIFLIGLEMILGRHIFRPDTENNTSSIIPLAFPLIAGTGTMTTILSLRAKYATPDILVSIILNLILVYLVLKSSDWLGKKLGNSGAEILRKVFGTVLISIAIKLFTGGIHGLMAAF
jgi:multiple antibiotic resistance protein